MTRMTTVYEREDVYLTYYDDFLGFAWTIARCDYSIIVAIWIGYIYRNKTVS